MTIQTRNLTIMFTDLKGFTEKTSRISREKMHDLLIIHDELIIPVIRRFGGNIVKNIGDAYLVTFESPTDSVLCGLVIQDCFRNYNNSSNEESRLEIRVAINSGEVELKNNDVFGEAVNIAARIESITEANEVYFTEAVYLAMNKQEVPSSEIGLKRLKGIPEPIKIFRVIQDNTSLTYQDALKKKPFHPLDSETSAVKEKYITGKKTYALLKVLMAASVFSVFLFVFLKENIPGYHSGISSMEFNESKQLEIAETSCNENNEFTGEDQAVSNFSDNAENGILRNDFHFVDEPVCEILAEIGAIAKKSIVVDKDVSGTYSCHLACVAPEKAIELIAKANKLTVDEEDGILYIRPDKKSDRKKPRGDEAEISETKIEPKFDKLIKISGDSVAKTQMYGLLLNENDIEKNVEKSCSKLCDEDKKILIHVICKLFRDGKEFYQDADKCAKFFLSDWTKNPSREKMKEIILVSLERDSEKIISVEDAFESVKYTTYSKTKWSKAWGNMTGGQLGGKKYYRVLDSVTGKIVTVYEYLANEHENIKRNIANQKG